MRLKILLLMPLLLAACGSAPEKNDQIASRRISSTNPIFADHDPHPWEGRTPSHHAIHGIDVSRWQGDIDWHSVRNAGISFAYLKATEGGDVLDPKFEQNWALSARADMPRGAYHYYYFCRSPEEQARWFIDHVPRDSRALPHVLDMEWTHNSRTCQRRPDGATVRDEADRFLDILTRYYGKRPVVYTTVDFYRDTGIGDLPGTEFWVRSVAGHPGEVYPGQNWSFWQYTGTGVVPGIKGPVDINVFAGTIQNWQRWSNLDIASR